MSAGLTLAGGCESSSGVRVEIAAHYVPACAPDRAAAASQLELIALGDFDRSNDSVVIVQSDDAFRSVRLPDGTRAAELETLGGQAFWGSGTLDAHNRLSILLWPRESGCALARVDDGLSTDPEAWSLAASERLQSSLVSGPGRDAPIALHVDLATGTATRLDAARGPRVPRTHASLSELGDRLVLAGGVDASGRVLDSAELFDPARARFDASPAPLSGPRARHAALALPGGKTLLIGGESASGEPLASVEVLASDARFSRAFELLSAPRIAPRAVLLGPDRFLVGGGYVRSADGAREPLASVEILSTDFTDAPEPPLELAPAALDRAFVALGGGALAAGGCTPAASAPDCLPCEGGCVSREVWWIDPLGSPHAIEPLPEALAVARPELVAGAGGQPWLIADDRLGRFDPWAARFELVELGGASGAAALGPPVAIRPGTFAWLAAVASGVELAAVHHSQRGRWTQDVAPLLVGSPAGVLPERPPSAGDGEPVQLSYDVASGLTLGGSGAVVVIADTDYAAFDLELSLAAGPPPLVELAGSADPRGGVSFGGIECPWPELDPSGSLPARLRVQRALDRVRLELLGASGPLEPRAEPCSAALPERVSIRLAGTRSGATRLTRIEIRRVIE